MRDQFDREIEYMRISVTDRCNLRCQYCMPATGVKHLLHSEILSYEEILQIVRAAARLGVHKIRVTGGEPLVRRGIIDFIRQLKATEGIDKVVITTNGVLLDEMAADLLDAGIDGVNLSLDTLDAAEFHRITGKDGLESVLKALDTLLAAPTCKVKVNCVPIRGFNEDGLMDVAGLARDRAISVRFIELMPVGFAFEQGMRGIPMTRVEQLLQERYGPFRAEGDGLPKGDAGPARYVRPMNFQGELGFIDALGHKFCASCNRVRLTADGFLKLCLNARTGLDLKALLRQGADAAEIEEKMRTAIYRKPREHYFLEKTHDEADTRRMYQVGG
ncbi:GTP 3',8-cyclase MoaA [Selenomonas sp. TAMA-11512]|uniref:GTP 3',8-cyclase MoaA n=1 Tax=Selenomonas sp. TAMA-11512 TaxID=3095337 RepID=UPI0030869624|nr:GTP 3',8-cyclase MoaA [Selenomonas sp. TAMA-11512]